MQSVKVNDVELEYEVIGAGESVLLISPVIADGFLSLVAEPAIADRYQLIRYHKRGWVGSTHTPPAGQHRRPRRRRRGAARPSRRAARPHRRPLQRRGGRRAAGTRPSRVRAHGHAAGAVAVLRAQRRGLPHAGPARARGVRGRRPRRCAGDVHERREWPRVDAVQNAARAACSRCGGAGDQRRPHLLRRRAARSDRVGIRRRAGSRPPPVSAVCARRRHATSVGGSRRVPPLRRCHRSTNARSTARDTSCTCSVPSP
jgi:hypothetical protein